MRHGRDARATTAGKGFRRRLNEYSMHLVTTFAAPPGSPVHVRGDVAGPLVWNDHARCHAGMFLFVPGEKRGYDICVKKGDAEEVVESVALEYTRDETELVPTLAEITELGEGLTALFPDRVSVESIYTFPDSGREIKLFILTNRNVPAGKKQNILVTGRLHHWENSGVSALYLIRELLFGEGRQWLDAYTVLVIPFANPNVKDPRTIHNNRVWLVDNLVEPDAVAIKERVLDAFKPELWLDMHSGGPFFGAHPVGEEAFDYEWSQRIAEELVRAAEERGAARHLDNWASGLRGLKERGLIAEGEIPADPYVNKVFDARLYAAYYDRLRYGMRGRGFPATATEYGYGHCHCMSFFDESKWFQLKDPWTNTLLSYGATPEAPMSPVYKLLRLFAMGRERFPGNYHPGLPCTAVLQAANAESKDAVLVFAWSDTGDFEELRRARCLLWRDRKAISLVQKESRDGDRHVFSVEIFSRRLPGCTWAFRIPIPAGLVFKGASYHGLRFENERYRAGERRQEPEPLFEPEGKWVFIPLRPDRVESVLKVAFAR